MRLLSNALRAGQARSFGEPVESSLQNSSGRFDWLHLVPPLSLRERGLHIPRCDESRRSGLATARRTILPLPGGQGEGEATLETPMRLPSCTGPSWSATGSLFLGSTGYWFSVRESAKTNDLARPGRYASRQTHFPPEREPDQKFFMHPARALPAQPTEVNARPGRLGCRTLRELQRQARGGSW